MFKYSIGSLITCLWIFFMWSFSSSFFSNSEENEIQIQILIGTIMQVSQVFPGGYIMVLSESFKEEQVIAPLNFCNLVKINQVTPSKICFCFSLFFFVNYWFVNLHEIQVLS